MVAGLAVLVKGLGAGIMRHAIPLTIGAGGTEGGSRRAGLAERARVLGAGGGGVYGTGLAEG